MSNIGFSKTGKHGHAKWTFFVDYPFTDQTSQEMFPGHTKLSQPKMKKTEFVLSGVSLDRQTKMPDGSVTLIDDAGEEVHCWMNPTTATKKKPECGRDFFHQAMKFDDDHWETYAAAMGYEADEVDEEFSMDKELAVTILEGPCEKSKGNLWYRQIVDWKIRDA